MFTYKNLTGHKHRFTNDVQISIGDAHSGYPVDVYKRQNTRYQQRGQFAPRTQHFM